MVVPGAGQTVVFAQHHGRAEDARDVAEVVGGADEGLAGLVEGHDDLPEEVLHARIQAVHGLVQDEHFRIERQHRGERHLALLALAQVVRDPAPQLPDAEQGDAVLHALGYGFLLQAHLPGTEGDLLLHHRAEELGIGVLEQEADPLVEALGEAGLPEPLRVDRLAVEAVGALPWQHQSVQQLQQRRLAAPVGTDDGHGIAAANVQRQFREHVAPVVRAGHPAQLDHRVLVSR